MGKETDKSTQRFNSSSPVRMAYTLNNRQPVVCTLVSDQPYFYIEEDIFEDDDGLFSDSFMRECFSELEGDIADLKHKIESYERLSSEFTQPSDQSFQDFLSDSDRICGAFHADTDKKAKAEEITDTLRHSRMAQALMGCAEEHGVEIICSNHTKEAVYDRKAGKILINPALSHEDQILLAAKELRRHWQHRRGVLLHPLSFHPDQAILINRAQHADLSISMIRIAWELQLAEYKETWKRIENSSLADLGRAFAREAFVDFRSLNNGAACAAVFEAWFLSERCRYHDKELIQIMLADYQGHVFGSEQASRSISIDLICSLGEQPFGKNYLSTHAQMILSDPVFTDIRDRSNANFLWFIKFERSFRETERHLQSSDIKTAPENLEGHIMNTLEDRNHDPEFISAASSAGSNSNVVHVSFGAISAKRDEVL